MKNCFEFQPRRLIVHLSRWKRTRQHLHRRVVPVKRLWPSLSVSVASPPPRRGGSTFIEGRFAAKSSLNLPSTNQPFVRIEFFSSIVLNSKQMFDSCSWSWQLSFILIYNFNSLCSLHCAARPKEASGAEMICEDKLFYDYINKFFYNFYLSSNTTSPMRFIMIANI